VSPWHDGCGGGSRRHATDSKRVNADVSAENKMNRKSYRTAMLVLTLWEALSLRFVYSHLVDSAVTFPVHVSVMWLGRTVFLGLLLPLWNERWWTIPVLAGAVALVAVPPVLLGFPEQAYHVLLSGSFLSMFLIGGRLLTRRQERQRLAEPVACGYRR
jgi:hypothetical protein